MDTSYLPIDPDIFEIIEKEIQKDSLRVLYFGFDNYPALEEVSGKAIKIERDNKNAFFIIFADNKKVRLDRIVVINGIPGPSYDEYDEYALAPLTCKAGYDFEC